MKFSLSLQQFSILLVIYIPLINIFYAYFTPFFSIHYVYFNSKPILYSFPNYPTFFKVYLYISFYLFISPV